MQDSMHAYLKWILGLLLQDKNKLNIQQLTTIPIKFQRYLFLQILVTHLPGKIKKLE
jgi:hypothetical protein